MGRLPPEERVRAARVVRVEAGVGVEADEALVVEEPLEIRVDGEPTAVTMRTPGDDLDLAAGFLYTEGVVDGWDDVRAIAIVGENRVDVRLAEGVPPARARSADRTLYASSSCGICGKASIDRIRRTRATVAGWMPTPEMIEALPGRLAAFQATFAATGGLHAAGWFDRDGVVVDAREDVGRHNAVDKLIGAWLRAGREWDGLGMVVSSRAGFEIVSKALVAGVPVVVAMGAATSLAAEAAAESGMTLVTWVRGDRHVILRPPRP